MTDGERMQHVLSEPAPRAVETPAAEVEAGKPPEESAPVMPPEETLKE